MPLKKEHFHSSIQVRHVPEGCSSCKPSSALPDMVHHIRMSLHHHITSCHHISTSWHDHIMPSHHCITSYHHVIPSLHHIINYIITSHRRIITSCHRVTSSCHHITYHVIMRRHHHITLVCGMDNIVLIGPNKLDLASTLDAPVKGTSPSGWRWTPQIHGSPSSMKLLGFNSWEQKLANFCKGSQSRYIRLLGKIWSL